MGMLNKGQCQDSGRERTKGFLHVCHLGLFWRVINVCRLRAYYLPYLLSDSYVCSRVGPQSARMSFCISSVRTTATNPMRVVPDMFFREGIFLCMCVSVCSV